MKKLKEILQIIYFVLIALILCGLILAMSFIPYDPVTQEDIERMELREKMRYEQMIW